MFHLPASTGSDNLTSLLPTVNRYLAERGDERVKDWAGWVANAKFRNESERAGAEASLSVQDLRPSDGQMSFVKMQHALRLVVLKVMHENGIDAFVNPEVTLPHYKLGGPTEPTVNDRGTGSCCQTFTAILGGPEIEVPAGYNQIVYEPQFVLSPDKKRYLAVSGTTQSMLPKPMPISMMFWAGPGSEPALIKAASAYQNASKHRVPPPDFGPLPGEP